MSGENQPVDPYPIAELFCTLDLIKSGMWGFVGKAEVPTSMLHEFGIFTSYSVLPCTIYGSRNIANLIEAFNGLRPWDEMADPDYYKTMLLDGVVPTFL